MSSSVVDVGHFVVLSVLFSQWENRNMSKESKGKIHPQMFLHFIL